MYLFTQAVLLTNQEKSLHILILIAASTGPPPTTTPVRTTTPIQPTTPIQTSTAPPPTVSECPVIDEMSRSTHILDSMIETSPPISRVAAVRDSDRGTGWIVHPDSEPIITVHLVPDDNIPPPLVEKVVVNPHDNVKTVRLEGKKPPSTPGQVVPFEELVTADIEPDGSIRLPHLTELTWIRIVFVTPINPDDDYRIKIGIFACYVPQRKIVYFLL